MGELTHPIAYFDFYGKTHDPGVKRGLLLGGILAALGIIYRAAPFPRRLLRSLAGGGAADLMDYFGWLLLVLLGGTLVFLLLRRPRRYSGLTLFPNGFSLSGRDGKAPHLFPEVEGVTEYRMGNRRITQIDLGNGHKPLRWDNEQLKDYRAFLTQMEQLRCDALLGSDFPENIAALSLPLAKHLQLSGGVLHYKGKAIPPESLKSYTAKPYEEITGAIPDIVITYGNGQRLELLPEKISNRTALLRILDAMVQKISACEAAGDADPPRQEKPADEEALSAAPDEAEAVSGTSADGDCEPVETIPPIPEDFIR